MYHIPQNIDLSDIVGAEIHQICLGRHDVQFFFTSETRIALQSEATLLEKGEVIAIWNEQKNWTSLAFQRILGERIERYTVPNDRLLEIHFNSELVLQLHDSSDQFESMQIYPRGDVIGQIVV